MKKRNCYLVFVIIASLSMGTVTYAAGNVSKVEKKWLEFYEALMEQKVKDKLVTKEEAKKILKDLEERLKASPVDEIYERFTKKKHGDHERKPADGKQKEQPGRPKPFVTAKQETDGGSAPKEESKKSDVTNPKKVEGQIRMQERLIRVYAELAKKSVDDVKTLCESQDATIWQLAQKEGLLEQFKTAVIQDVEKDIRSRVEKGDMTKEKGDEILKRISDHVEKMGV